MSESHKPLLGRREFIVGAAGGAALLGAGVGIGLWAGQREPGKGAGQKRGENIPIEPIDPKLITWQQTQLLEPGLMVAWAMTMGVDEQIVVAGDKRIARMTKAGEQLAPLECSAAPRAVVVDREGDGSVFAATRKVVEIFDRNGRRSAQWSPPGGEGLFTSIAVSDDNVFLADVHKRIVLRCDRQGKLINRIGERDTTKRTRGFNVPSPYFDLTVGTDGLLWVVNPGQHRLEAFTFEGDMETSWGGFSGAVDGFCGCCNPVNIAQLPDGRFVTAEKGILRVKVYGHDGTFETVVAGPDTFAPPADCRGTDLEECSGKSLDVAVAAKDRVYVLDQAAASVRLMQPKA